MCFLSFGLRLREFELSYVLSQNTKKVTECLTHVCFGFVGLLPNLEYLECALFRFPRRFFWLFIILTVYGYLKFEMKVKMRKIELTWNVFFQLTLNHDFFMNTLPCDRLPYYRIGPLIRLYLNEKINKKNYVWKKIEVTLVMTYLYDVTVINGMDLKWIDFLSARVSWTFWNACLNNEGNNEELTSYNKL